MEFLVIIIARVCMFVCTFVRKNNEDIKNLEFLVIIIVCMFVCTFVPKNKRILKASGNLSQGNKFPSHYNCWSTLAGASKFVLLSAKIVRYKKNLMKYLLSQGKGISSYSFLLLGVSFCFIIFPLSSLIF